MFSIKIFDCFKISIIISLQSLLLCLVTRQFVIIIDMLCFMLSVESVMNIPIFGDLTYGSVARQNDKISPRETNPVSATVMYSFVNDGHWWPLLFSAKRRFLDL